MTNPLPLAVSESEVEFSAIRAQGAGGQNVNKVSSAVHLRFDIRASSLPEPVKARLLALRDQRITADGVIVIKAQTTRSQDMNRADAMLRLNEIVNSVAVPPKPPKRTFVSERFIALHMIWHKMMPLAPTSEPAMTSTLLSITKPLAAAAMPE